MAVYLSLVSCILLSAVAGLLVMVGFQVRQMRLALKDAPTLGDAVGQQLTMAKEALANLDKGAREVAPKLEKNVREAQMASQDLTYLNQRAEEILQLLEKNIENAQLLQGQMGVQAVVQQQVQALAEMTVPAITPAVARGVTGANEAASREPGDSVANDPLETLLAGLAAARVEGDAPVSKKPTPPTAMEVLMGVAPQPVAEDKPINPLRLVADMQAMKRREKSQAEMDLHEAVMRRAG